MLLLLRPIVQTSGQSGQATRIVQASDNAPRVSVTDTAPRIASVSDTAPRPVRVN